MQRWHLYIIENKLGQLYTGVTTDVPRRFAEHQSSKSRAAKALKGKVPLQLRYSCCFANKSDALKAESWTKKRNKQGKLKIIDGAISPPGVLAK